MDHPTVRRIVRTTVLAAAVVALGTVATSGTPATAQRGSVELRLESTGTASASLTIGDQQIPVPTNTEHPYGWSGEGTLTITAAGSCRIVVNGSVVAEHAGPGAMCRWP